MVAVPEPRTHVLVLATEARKRRTLSDQLSTRGIEVVEVSSVAAALARVERGDRDVVVADLGRPESSASFLGAIRERDPDLPVVLLTDVPDLESAILAVNLGAFRYLVNPVPIDELHQVVRRAGVLRSLARLRHAAMAAVDAEDERRRTLESRFSVAIDELWMAYQPIVTTRDWDLLGYEALLRTDGGGFASPEALIGAALRLERTKELGRAVRAAVASDARRLPEDAAVFVNLLPSDLLDHELYATDAPLTKIASRVVLELTERATFDSVPDLSRRVAELRRLGFRIALDDLGAGSSGLTSLTQLEPDLVKLDRTLVRDVHLSSHRQAVVRSVVELCRSLGISVVGEGVEGFAEEEALREMEVELLQGFLIAAPNREVRRPRTAVH